MFTRSATRRPGRAVAAVATIGLSAGAAFAGVGSASSAPLITGPECPEAFPVADLVRDQPVDGLTVSRDATPEAFTGTVIGVLDDGIAPGLDMVLVDLTSPEIDRVGGIWSGMSGSPVYAEDGRLIGAVSYGLAWGSSPVAGVTPAADMQAVITGGDMVGRPAAKVALPARTAARIVDSGAATTSEVEEGMRRLRIPMAVSGAFTGERAERVAAMQEKTGVKLGRTVKKSAVKMYAGAGTSALATADDIVPGGNLGASLSYGDYSAVGIGTVTAVCGTEVLAFGHPMNFMGESTMTMHAADALYVQEDPVSSPFKVANPGAPVGVVSQDRLAAIAGSLGTIPETTLITTDVTAEEGGSRVGETHVSVPEFVPDAALMALLLNQDRVFDEYGPGSAEMSYTITGSTSDGTPFTLSRSNKFASEWDISFETVWDVASSLYDLVYNDFTEVTIDDVDVTSVMNDEPRNFRIRTVEAKQDGEWVKLKRRQALKVQAGDVVKLRVGMTSYRDIYGSKLQRLNVAIPKKVKPRSYGELIVAGGQEMGWYMSAGGANDSVADIIEDIESRPRNDELVAMASIYQRKAGTKTSSASALIGDVVVGGRYYTLRVKR